ncbi:MAG: PfkB family carbohydrate kinase, partial [Candidatus Anstonellales archaeon]
TLFRKNGNYGEILCLVDEKGQRTFIADLGVSEQFKLDYSYIKEIVDTTSSIYMTSITLLKKNEISYTAKKIFEYATLKNKFFIISLESPKMLSKNRVKILEILKKSNLVFANEEEIMAVFGKDYLIELQHFIQINSLANRLIYIKLGKKGSMVIKNDGKFIKCPAFKVNKIVDTTAAGDNFIAGVLFGLLFFNDEINAMKLGNYLGYLTIQNLGPSIRNLEKEISKDSLMNLFIV